MGAFLLYNGKVAVALLVFYLFYRFLLKKETFHRFNRVVLVGTTVLSFLLPLCIITIHRPLETSPLVPSVPVLVSDVPEVASAPVVEASAPWWPVALTVLFWTGVACVLVRVMVSALSIARIIRRGEIVGEEDGCKIVVTERDIDPFSWMKYIVLSRKDWELPHESILSHEKAHIANIKEYQYLLIRKAVSKSGYSVANSFNHSILKNRITMMSKSKSPLSRGLRALYALPLVCLAIGLQAKTVYVPTDKDSEKISAEEPFNHVLPEVTVVRYASADVKPEDVIHVSDLENFKATGENDFDTAPSCSENFSHWLNARISYPESCLYEGTVLAVFEVGTDGKVGKVETVVGVCDELNEAVKKLIGQSPAWTPAQKDGKPVATVLFQPVVFRIRTAAATGASSQAMVLK